MGMSEFRNIDLSLHFATEFALNVIRDDGLWENGDTLATYCMMSV